MFSMIFPAHFGKKAVGRWFVAEGGDQGGSAGREAEMGVDGKTGSGSPAPDAAAPAVAPFVCRQTLRHALLPPLLRAVSRRHAAENRHLRQEDASPFLRGKRTAH